LYNSIKPLAIFTLSVFSANKQRVFGGTDYTNIPPEPHAESEIGVMMRKLILLKF